jgi:hypothetical protein
MENTNQATLEQKKDEVLMETLSNILNVFETGSVDAEAIEKTKMLGQEILNQDPNDTEFADTLKLHSEFPFNMTQSNAFKELRKQIAANQAE